MTVSLALGAKLGPCSYVVTRSDLVRYAGASGDFNPIHFSASTASSPQRPPVWETLALFCDLLQQEEQPTVASVDYWDKLPEDPRNRKRGHLSIIRDDA